MPGRGREESIDVMNEYGLKAPGSCGCPPEELPAWSSASPDSPARQMDLSRPLFRAALDVPVAELFQALPKVKGAPILSAVDTNGETTLSVQVQYPEDPVDPYANSPVYSSGSNPAAVPTAVTGIKEFKLARMGYYVPATKIDSKAVAWVASGNPAATRLPTAVSYLASWVDYFLGRGDGTETPPAFEGLVKYAGSIQRIITPGSAINPDEAARLAMTKVNPRDRGAGASVDCLIGNDRMVRSLMNTTGGLTGSSGWRVDARTGLNVYHYAGLPVYRCNLDDFSAVNNQGYLFAANLGRDGLSLVHAYGTADTLGIQVDEEPISPQQGQVRYVVHGAWALFAFDPGALIGYGKVTYTSD